MWYMSQDLLLCCKMYQLDPQTASKGECMTPSSEPIPAGNPIHRAEIALWRSVAAFLAMAY